MNFNQLPYAQRIDVAKKIQSSSLSNGAWSYIIATITIFMIKAITSPYGGFFEFCCAFLDITMNLPVADTLLVGILTILTATHVIIGSASWHDHYMITRIIRHWERTEG